MAQRAALPAEAVTITPGYSWRLDLDVRFDGERPDDWPDWTIRMLIWGQGFGGMKLTNGAGVSFELVDGLPGAAGPLLIPVIAMTGAQSEGLRGKQGLTYVLDLKAPGGEAEDYFAGPLCLASSPPPDLLQ